MFYQRKNVDNSWFSFHLNKKEISEVQTVAVSQGLAILLKINKIAGENSIKLTDSDRAAVLNFAGRTLEGFTSDLMEAKLATEKAEKDKSANKPQ